MRAPTWTAMLRRVDPPPRPALLRRRARGGTDDAAALLNALPVAAALLGGDGAIRLANAALLDAVAPHARPRPGARFLSLLAAPAPDVFECLAGLRSGADVLLAHPAAAAAFRLSLAGLPAGDRVAFLQPPAPDRDEEAERLRGLGQLAGGVAHDVNNLLGIILGALDAARRVAPGAAPALAPAQDAAARGAALAARLLAVARRQVLAPKVIELDPAVSGTVSLLRSMLGPGIALDLSPGAPGRRIRVDPVQFDQVLLNLAVNARDAMAGRGTVTIRTGHKVALREEPGTPDPLPPGRWTILTVSDTGPGIAPADLARVVEPFFSTKAGAGGTGLGLATVHGIVRQSGGVLQIDPTGGPGACFRIHLPRHEGEEPPALVATNPVPASLRILLVEDEPLLRRLSAASLAAAGHDVTDAADAEDALDLLAGGLVPDLLLSDVTLPGLDGLSLARAARGICPGLRVILSSGYAPATLGADLPAEGIAFLAKPYRTAELLAAISGPG
ncbi:ATP-binding protein [Roseomonas sp. CCTCC AB2023176]|uniref:ATP-binding protein n=1 Tax=Roseomonas sp. CCTCC AB2023176 TaxID=3342640 RepID=UPI0035E2BEC5